MATEPTPRPLPRWFPWALALAVALAWVLRARPLWRFGPWQVPVDYDEGVYASAALLLWEGVRPYRDYVFVHPPGLPVFLALAHLAAPADPAQAFGVMRWLATGLGAASTLLVGLVGGRWRGAAAGLLAALAYATYPEAAAVERGPFLEGLLDALALAGVWVWLGAPTRRRALLAGGLLGAAACTQLTGGVYLLAALVAVPPGAARRQVPALLGGALLAALALLLPFALAAPQALFEQLVRFHAVRPPDGLTARDARLEELVLGGHRFAGVLALAGAALAVRGLRAERAARLTLVALVLQLLLLLAAATYSRQDNAALAPAQALLAGAGGAALLAWLAGRGHRPELAGAVALALGLFVDARSTVLESRAHGTGLLELAQGLRARAPACAVGFEPAWTLAAGRLPPPDPHGRRLVDPYGAMLLAGVRGEGAPSVEAAFARPAAQAVAGDVLEGCDLVVLGDRGRQQLGAAGLDRLARTHRPLPREDFGGAEVWAR